MVIVFNSSAIVFRPWDLVAVPENPFSQPLGSGLPASVPDSPSPLAMPRRMRLAQRALRRPATWLFWVYLSWIVFLVFLIAVTMFELLTGESVSMIGGLVASIVAISDVLWPYNYPLALFSLILSGFGLLGAVHCLRQQNLFLARAAAHLSYLPLLGPWCGLFALVGIFVLRVLRRDAVAHSFDTG